MAEDALSIVEGGFAGGKIAAMGDTVQRGFDVGHRPMLDKLAFFGLLESGYGGVIFDPRIQRNPLFRRKGRAGVFPDVEQVLWVAGAVTVIAICLLEPFEQRGRMPFAGFFLVRPKQVRRAFRVSDFSLRWLLGKL